METIDHRKKLETGHKSELEKKILGEKLVKISKLTFSPGSPQLPESGSDVIDTSMTNDRKDEENR